MVQPLDKTIIRSFKSNMRKRWKAWKIEANDEHGRSPQIPREAVLRMIEDSWSCITAEAINTTWRACGLLQADEPVPEHVDEAVIDFESADAKDDGLEFVDFDDDEIA